MKPVYASNLAEYIAQERDSTFAKQLDSALQANAERLFTKFNHRLNMQIKIQIFPAFNITTCVCGDDTLKDVSALACTRYKKINMASSFSTGTAYIYSDPTLVVLHEYAHAITFDIIGEKKMWTLPPWLREGLAQQTEFVPHYKYQAPMIYVRRKIKANEIPSLKSLCKNYSTVEYASIWAGWFSEYVTYRYGWETMLTLMKNDGKLVKTIGTSYKPLEKEWIGYMKTNIDKTNTKQ